MMNVDTDSAADRILSLVDQTANADDSPLTPAQRNAATAAAQKAYYDARARNMTPDQARIDASNAYVAEGKKQLAAAMPAPAIDAETREAGFVDAEGKARSQADVDALTASGFKMAETVYERGTIVNQTGVDNARASRDEWLSMPPVTDACRAHEARVVAEQRKDSVGPVCELAMLPNGDLTAKGRTAGAHMTGRALRQLASKFEDAAHGGSYLMSCPTELRAVNVNHWTSVAKPDATVKLRARNGLKHGTREVFAVVSESYACFDGDKVAEAFRIAAPEGARGTVRYDGERTTIDAHFQTTVQPEKFVAGEVFRVGVQVTTSDVGGGAIVVRSTALQNLCRNLIILDAAALPIASLRHVGNVQTLAAKFRAAIVKATSAIAPFLVRWNYACTERLTGNYAGTSAHDVMRGTFAGLVDGGLRLPGHSAKESIDSLIGMWAKDHSSATLSYDGATRAAVVNALTRAAHELKFEDPWVVDDLQETAAKLLWPRGANGPLPSLAWVDPAVVIEKARTSDEALRQIGR